MTRACFASNSDLSTKALSAAGVSNKMIQDQQVVARRAQLLEADADGEIVGLHVEQGVCYGFNSTSTLVWRMLEQPRSKAELRHALLREFDVDEVTCDENLDALLRTLEKHELVEIKAATA